LTDGAQSKTALVLEDEPIIAFALEDMLLDLGFEKVLVAGTLNEARQLLDAHKPSAAILDVNIHGEQSYPVAKMLAELSVPFIFATGYGDAQHPEELRSVPTLTKPYHARDLQRALASA
jgi:CheY-like chemotaxis protein